MRVAKLMAVLCVLAVAGLAAAGPVLDWVNSNRPGWLIPKPGVDKPVPVVPPKNPGPQPIVIPPASKAVPPCDCCGPDCKCPDCKCKSIESVRYGILPVGGAVDVGYTAIPCPI